SIWQARRLPYNQKMRKRIVVLIASAMTFIAIAEVEAIDPNRPHNERPPSVAAATYGAAGEQEKKQKYTCPMHPEIVTDHPGNCPKCGMKLVPLKQNKRPTSNAQGSRAGAEHATPKVGAIDLNRPGHEHDHPPSHGYGAAGEHEQEKMHMEMHSTVNLADPMNR